MAFSVSYIYEIINRYSGPLSKITRDTNKYQRAAASAAKRVNNLSERLKKAGDRMADMRTAIGGAAITAAIYKFTKSASTMEDAMADVGRVTGLVGPRLKFLQGDLEKLGRQTGRSALGLAAIAFEGGKLDIANDKLGDFVFMVLKTAAAFDMAEGEAGRAIGSIRAKLGLSVGSVNDLMQRVNFLADNTSATGASMIEIIERTSGSMKMLKIPGEVMAGWAAFANQLEVTPQLAASGINMMMARMMKMPGMLDKMLKDPKNSVIKFLQRFEQMPEAQRGAKILKVFGNEAGRFVMKAVSNMELLDEAMDKAKAAEALGSMDREFANIMARSSTAAGKIKETFADISRAIGVVFLKMFNKYSDRIFAISEKILSFVKAHPILIKTVGILGGLLAAFAGIAVTIGIVSLAISSLLPVLATVLGAFAALSFSVMAPYLAFAALALIITAMFVKSANLRQSFMNLADSLAPLLKALKPVMYFLGEQMGMELDRSGNQLQAWGDMFAIVINGIAAMIKGLFNLIEGLAKATAALVEGEGIGAAWTALKGTLGYEVAAAPTAGIGQGVAEEKRSARMAAAEREKLEVSGQIGVVGRDGSTVTDSTINLNQGYNLAAAH
jgi:TP901 family phage tail tape measure protein